MMKYLYTANILNKPLFWRINTNFKEKRKKLLIFNCSYILKVDNIFVGFFPHGYENVCRQCGKLFSIILFKLQSASYQLSDYSVPFWKKMLLFPKNTVYSTLIIRIYCDILNYWLFWIVPLKAVFLLTWLPFYFLISDTTFPPLI